MASYIDRYVEVTSKDGTVNRIYLLNMEKGGKSMDSGTEVLYSSGVWHTPRSDYYTALITRLQPGYQCNGWINKLTDVTQISQHTRCY